MSRQRHKARAQRPDNCSRLISGGGGGGGGPETRTFHPLEHRRRNLSVLILEDKEKLSQEAYMFPADFSKCSRKRNRNRNRNRSRLRPFSHPPGSTCRPFCHFAHNVNLYSVQSKKKIYSQGGAESTVKPV